MRKIIKKIVAVATTLSMTAAMGIMAFAADSYTFVGNPHLFGIDADEDPDGNKGWVTTAQDQKFTEAGDGYYTAKFTCASAGEYEYKVVGDGDIFAWSYQLCFGNPDSAWADNQTQFKGKFEAGEYTAVLNPSQGMLVCVQNGKVVDFTIRYKSRDEDSPNFVEPSVAAVKADGYDPQDFDANFEAIKAKALELEGGTTAEPETTTAAPAETTTAAGSTQPTTAAGSTQPTTAAKPVQTGDVAPVAVIGTLLAAVAVVAIAAKKKEA